MEQMVEVYRKVQKEDYCIELRLVEHAGAWTYGYTICLPGWIGGHNLYKDMESVQAYTRDDAIQMGLKTIFETIQQEATCYPDIVNLQVVKEFFKEVPDLTSLLFLLF